MKTYMVGVKIYMVGVKIYMARAVIGDKRMPHCHMLRLMARPRCHLMPWCPPTGWAATVRVAIRAIIRVAVRDAVRDAVRIAVRPWLEVCAGHVRRSKHCCCRT